MQEAIIHLPVTNNYGRNLDHERSVAEELILDLFGGFTCEEATGAWKSPEGKIYREPMMVYRIAGNWDDDANVVNLVDLATDLAASMEQEAIYLALPSGVQFIEPMPAAA